MPSFARSVHKPLKVPSLARSVLKPLKEPSLARSVPKPLSIFALRHVLCPSHYQASLSLVTVSAEGRVTPFLANPASFWHFFFTGVFCFFLLKKQGHFY